MTLWKSDGKLVMTMAGAYIGTACSDVSALCFVESHNHEVTQQTQEQVRREAIERDERNYYHQGGRANW